MAWTKTEWACGHSGSMQLYGKGSARAAQAARAAGMQCMACWLIEQWEKDNDPRAKRVDRYKLAAAIAENKGKRIDVPDSVPVVKENNLLATFSSDELIAEIERRKTSKQL